MKRTNILLWLLVIAAPFLLAGFFYVLPIFDPRVR
jgi:cytochrome bd-type quinol oxidase subunit 2